MAGGAMGSEGTGGSAQNLSQLTQILQKMGAGSQGQAGGGAGTAFPMMSNLGNSMMQMGGPQGMAARPPMPMPTQRLAMPQALQGPTPPQMGAPGMMSGGMGMPGGGMGGMNPSQMNMLLARQNGLMG